MEKLLFDAAYEGDAVALFRLRHENPHFFKRTHLDCEDKNVLHISAMLGHVEFVKEILRSNPFSYRMCFARDRDGRNPLHCAAISGQQDILRLILTYTYDELVEAALEKADEGGTILHLCVKYNQLEALKLLLKYFSHSKMVFAKNNDGMTIMHMAFTYNNNQRRHEIIIHLLKKAPKIVNEKDANGKTVLDIYLWQTNRSLDYFESFFPENRRSRLQREDILHYSLLMSAALTSDVVDILDLRKLASGIFDKGKDAIMIVASLIATMAFQGLVSPPGGVWQDNSSPGSTKPHTAGESVTAQNRPLLYWMLIVSNTIAFVSSMSSILILLFRGGVHRFNFKTATSWFYVLLTAMHLSVTAISAAYAISLVIIAPESIKRRWSAPTAVVIVVFLVWYLPLTFHLSLEFLSRKNTRFHKIVNDGKVKVHW